MNKLNILSFALVMGMLLAFTPAALAEPSIEQIASDNGIVIGTETGMETISVSPGEVRNVFLIAEYAGMSGGTSGGWYVAGDTSTRSILFSGPDSPVIEETFTVPDGVTEIGFYIQPEWYPGTYWYSETQFNIDKVDHVEIYVEENGGYLVGFEDLSGGGDWDYNDHVFLVGPVPEFMFAAMPLAIIAAVLIFANLTARKKK